MASLFSDFLSALKVRHTEEYSDKRFAAMPFQSMFGLSNLLKEYGVSSVGVKVPAESKMEALRSFSCPFLADTPEGFTIILGCDASGVTYRTQHKTFTASVEEVADGWNGISLLAKSDHNSIEPEYLSHHIAEIANIVKRRILCILVAALLVYAMFASGIYRQWGAWLLLALDCAGIWLSWMLVQKSLGVNNKSADAVCGVLEEGGCDEIASSEAASFLGIFKWSEVGLAYFGTSLLSMVLFPHTLPVLAAINILCLPYTVWSILYQRFKAKTWCTLCVFVQATLWLLFFSYLAGGFTSKILPFSEGFFITFVVMACTYVAVLLGINALDSMISKLK